MNLNNKVIKVLNLEHGKKVIEFFKKNGIDTKFHEGLCTEKDGREDIYYGVIANFFSNYYLSNVKRSKCDIIELPKDNPYPKVMYVSDSPIVNINTADKRVVFMEKNGYFLAWSHAETIKDSEKESHIYSWKYAKDIEEEKESIIELTPQDISEGKGVGISPHLIRIKK